MHDACKWVLISTISQQQQYHSLPTQSDLRHGNPRRRTELHILSRSVQALTKNQDKHIKCQTVLRLHGGAPQLSLIIGAIFVSMVYRCISISLTRDRPGNIQDIGENENPTQNTISVISKPARKNHVRGKISVPTVYPADKCSGSLPPSNGQTLENSAHRNSALVTGPVKMVLVVRTDLRMSTGKVIKLESNCAGGDN